MLLPTESFLLQVLQTRLRRKWHDVVIARDFLWHKASNGGIIFGCVMSHSPVMTVSWSTRLISMVRMSSLFCPAIRHHWTSWLRLSEWLCQWTMMTISHLCLQHHWPLEIHCQLESARISWSLLQWLPLLTVAANNLGTLCVAVANTLQGTTPSHTAEQAEFFGPHHWPD